MWWFQRSPRGVADLKVGKLRLVAITPRMMQVEETELPASGKLAELLGAKLAAEWPPEHWEPHVLRFIAQQFEERPETVGWHRYVLLREGLRRTLIGCVGAFPKEDGVVEMGYSTLPAYQRRGFGSEAARTLVEYLLRQDGVTAVTAQTTVGSAESIKVMERCGMVYWGVGDEPGTVRYRRER